MISLIISYAFSHLKDMKSIQQPCSLDLNHRLGHAGHPHAPPLSRSSSYEPRRSVVKGWNCNWIFMATTVVPPQLCLLVYKPLEIN